MMKPVPLRQRRVIEVVETDEEVVDEYSDGSRVRGVAAGANTTSSEYLGRYAMVMDAEMLGIAISLEQGHETVALDSQVSREQHSCLQSRRDRGSSNGYSRH